MKSNSAQRHFAYKHPVFGTKKNPKPERAWKNTVYYLWWEYLNRNEEYLNRFKSKSTNKDQLCLDFGDVRKQSFKDWWKDKGVYLFAEPSADEMVKVLSQKDSVPNEMNAITISFPFNLPKKFLEKRFRAIIKDKHSGRRGIQNAKHSHARYKINGQPFLGSLKNALRVYDCKKEHPEFKLWEIAIHLNISQGDPIKSTDTKYIVVAKKNRLGATIGRYLKSARQHIKNTSKGIFP